MYEWVWGQRRVLIKLYHLENLTQATSWNSCEVCVFFLQTCQAKQQHGHNSLILSWRNRGPNVSLRFRWAHGKERSNVYWWLLMYIEGKYLQVVPVRHVRATMHMNFFLESEIKPVGTPTKHNRTPPTSPQHTPTDLCVHKILQHDDSQQEGICFQGSDYTVCICICTGLCGGWCIAVFTPHLEGTKRSTANPLGSIEFQKPASIATTGALTKRCLWAPYPNMFLGGHRA